MKSVTAILLSVAALGVFAKPQPNQSFQSYGSYLPVINSHIQTSVVENPTVNFPNFIPSATVSESCHCLNTLVRPQLRNEVITVPSVDRIVRTVATPMVETIDCGGGTRLTTFGNGQNGGVTGGNGEGHNRQNQNLNFVVRPTIFAFQATDGRKGFSNGGIINAFQIRK